MSGPPPTSSPPPIPPGPPPGPPAYPPYVPYPWYPPPPPRDNLVLIIVIVVVIVFLVPIVLSALLYVMVSGLIHGPYEAPTPRVLFGSVDQTNGNATIPILSGSAPMSPSQLQIVLRANDSASSVVGMPPPDGSVGVTAAGYVLRIFWLDNLPDDNVGSSDAFWITGNLAPLPPATRFEFTLKFLGPMGATSITWTTP